MDSMGLWRCQRILLFPGDTTSAGHPKSSQTAISSQKRQLETAVRVLCSKDQGENGDENE